MVHIVCTIENQSVLHRVFHTQRKKREMNKKKHFFCRAFFFFVQSNRPSHIFYRSCFFGSSYHLITFLFSPSLVDFLFVFFSYQQTVKMSWNDDYFFVHRDGFSSCTIAFAIAFAYLAFFRHLTHFFSICVQNIQFRASITGALQQQWMKSFFAIASIKGIFELFSQCVFFSSLLHHHSL